MKKLFGLFKKERPWFVVEARYSTPYGDNVYLFIFDKEHDITKAEQVTKNVSPQLHKPSFYGCWGTKYLKDITEKEIEFCKQTGYSTFKMGRYTNALNLNGVKQVEGYYTGPKL